MCKKEAIEILNNGDWWFHFDNDSCCLEKTEKELHEAIDFIIKLLEDNG